MDEFFYHEIVTIRIDVDGEPTSNDASERQLDNYENFSFRIHNDKKNLKEFYDKIDSVLKTVFDHE